MSGKKVSASTLALQQKWKEAALKMGGEGATIVVSKAQAKLLILKILRDEFKPMNITAIYKAQKAVVPSPILKACLDEMVTTKPLTPLMDDDDQEKAPRKKLKLSRSTGKDEFSGSVKVKHGRNVNSTLYYANQERLDNDGNGFPPQERLLIVNQMAEANSQKKCLLDKLRNTDRETSVLHSEPTNEKAVSILETEEAELTSLMAETSAARQFTENKARRIALQKSIDTMAKYWRKRRQLCLDFLEMMDNCTEGIISIKKCIKGEGQIPIESDEMVINAAIESIKAQYSRKHLMVRAKGVHLDSVQKGIGINSSFIGIKLGEKGKVCRVNMEPRAAEE